MSLGGESAPAPNPARDLDSNASPRFVVIGNFDGVHRGHRAVLDQAVREAKEAGWVPTVLTFHPHPVVVLTGQQRPPLTSMKRKRRLLEQSLPGLSVHVQPFTRQLSELSPEEFCEDVLVRTLNSRVVLVGRNFRFGKNRAGNLETLTDLGRKLGFEARAASLVGDEGGPFSSTRVREALAQGDVQLAARILSRPHLIVGRVVRGDGRGRALGFPTANLVDIEEVLPAEGVYAVAVYDAQSDGRFLDAGVAHCGSRPTLDRPASFEVHLLNQRLDLYDRTLGVCFFARVRGVQKFANVAQLTAQIESDANVASAHLRSLPSLESTDWW